MSDPYRDGGYREPPEAPRDRGIVGDVIAQFADPHAFFRELIQNSIDAGSPEIAVEITYDRSAGRLHVAVRDRGEGMSREVVENQLLVLFRSTKEKDRTKIGKFGIGFSSVLAPDPEVVIITTAREGKKLTCHLYRDLSYELFDAGRASGAGTSVELEIAMPHETVADFCAASERALVRWCRHASVPIELVVPDGESTRRVRIDRPLDIEGALLEVRHASDGGELVVLAGLTRTPKSYVGFFNHGLMLAELDDEDLGAVSVKIQDSRLGHTLSRDNVRRDGAYNEAIAVARRVVDEHLPGKLSVRLLELASARDLTGYETLLEAALAAKVKPSQWWFPVIEPRGDGSVIEGAALGERPNALWAAARATPLTKALAERGDIVLHATSRDLIARAVEQAAGLGLRDAEDALTLVTPVPPTDADVALIALVDEILDTVHRRPAAIVFVELGYARADMLAVALREEGSRLLESADIDKNPFAFFGRRTLALSAEHPHVKAARTSDDPVLAAAHLVRAVLLQYRLLDVERSHLILEQTLAALRASS